MSNLVLGDISLPSNLVWFFSFSSSHAILVPNPLRRQEKMPIET